MNLHKSLCLMACLVSPSLHADDFSFTGTFSRDDEVQLFDFALDMESTVTFKTVSYAGGTQADGTIIAAGGVRPDLVCLRQLGELDR